MFYVKLIPSTGNFVQKFVCLVISFESILRWYIVILLTKKCAYHMAKECFKHKLTAILRADVKEYGSILRDEENETIRTLITYRTSIAKIIQQYRRIIVDYLDDNGLSKFEIIVDAVPCYVDIQLEISKRDPE